MNKSDQDIIEVVQKLNNKLKINHIDWHKLKGKKVHRSAELISAALCQLLISKNDNLNFIFTLSILSSVFYIWFEPWYILVLLFATSLDFYGALLINSKNFLLHRKIILYFCIFYNLTILGYFKYKFFLINSIFGFENLALIDFVLPLGISFYTFEAISYLLDVYNNKIPPQQKYVRYINFIIIYI